MYKIKMYRHKINIFFIFSDNPCLKIQVNLKDNVLFHHKSLNGTYQLSSKVNNEESWIMSSSRYSIFKNLPLKVNVLAKEDWTLERKLMRGFSKSEARRNIKML